MKSILQWIGVVLFSVMPVVLALGWMDDRNKKEAEIRELNARNSRLLVDLRDAQTESRIRASLLGVACQEVGKWGGSVAFCRANFGLPPIVGPLKPGND